jgi:hypothetical protein
MQNLVDLDFFTMLIVTCKVLFVLRVLQPYNPRRHNLQGIR